MAKPQKHPKDMTTAETIRHLFHPKVVEELERHAKELNDKPARKVKKGATK
jgi:hypothetical protein